MSILIMPGGAKPTIEEFISENCLTGAHGSKSDRRLRAIFAQEQNENAHNFASKNDKNKLLSLAESRVTRLSARLNSLFLSFLESKL